METLGTVAPVVDALGIVEVLYAEVTPELPFPNNEVVVLEDVCIGPGTFPNTAGRSFLITGLAECGVPAGGTELLLDVDRLLFGSVGAL